MARKQLHTPMLLGVGSMILLASSFPSCTRGAPVQVHEQDTVIPTYLAGAPEKSPMFFFGRQSQGAEGRIYPYPLYDTLTGKKVEKTYKLVYLENEYVAGGDRASCTRERPEDRPDGRRRDPAVTTRSPRASSLRGGAGCPGAPPAG
jgi:hypothetical protein